MAPSIANILTGPVDFYVKSYSAAGDPVTGNAVGWTGWTQLGFQTEDGVDIEYAPEFFDIKVHSYNAVVKKILIGEALKVRFNLMECDLAQMVHAMTGATYTAGALAGTNPNLLSLGDKATIVEKMIGFEGIAITGAELVGFVPKVVAMGTVAVKHQKAGVRTIPFEFDALADTTRSAGQTLAMLWEITEAA